MSVWFRLFGMKFGRSSKLSVKSPCSPHAVGVADADEAEDGPDKLDEDVALATLLDSPYAETVLEFSKGAFDIVAVDEAMAADDAEAAFADKAEEDAAGLRLAATVTSVETRIPEPPATLLELAAADRVNEPIELDSAGVACEPVADTEALDSTRFEVSCTGIPGAVLGRMPLDEPDTGAPDVSLGAFSVMVFSPLEGIETGTVLPLSPAAIAEGDPAEVIVEFIEPLAADVLISAGTEVINGWA